MEIKKVAVIGSGVMGHGIAQICAQVGKVDVIMRDMSEDLVQKGLSGIKGFLDKGIERGKLTREEADAVLSRIKTTTKLEDVADADLIIEAVPENMNIKRDLFTELDRLCKKEAIFASNASSLSITEIASITGKPERIVGMHWFNPPQLMKLIEVIIGSETSNDTAEALMDFSRKLGKTPIRVKDSPGFVVNRILQPWYNEGIGLIDENVAAPEDIDAAYRAFGFRMGPCQQRDLTGLDAGLATIKHLYEEFQDSRFRPPLIIKRLVKAGSLGRKSGKGFYNYEKGSTFK